MAEKYFYVQPEYVGKFRCDGQRCGALCCRGWRVPIDEATYEKYERIEPQSEAQRLTEHFTFDRKYNRYFLKHNSEKRCPFLRSDYLCSIQRQYGEDYLSNICRSYPRVTRELNGYYERALMITCPIAADLILSPSEPMTFEQVELDERAHRAGGESMRVKLPRGLLERTFDVQYAAISILQARNLMLDERLIVLGFFLDRLDELINAGCVEKIDELSAIYSSEEFLCTDAIRLSSSIEFDANAYIRTMFKILEALYGERSTFGGHNQRYLDAVGDTLDIRIDGNKDVSVREMAESYRRLRSARENFLQRNSIKLEHYLVNEFFIGFYPWKLDGTISQHYGIFISTYKILELIALSLEVQWGKWHAASEQVPEMYRLAATMSALSMNVDHNKEYLMCVKEHLDGDILSIMRSLL